MGRREVSKQERAIRHYFAASHRLLAAVLTVLGATLLVVGASPRGGGVVSLIGVGLILIGVVLYLGSLSRPPDADIDRWLEQGMSVRNEQAIKKLGLDESETWDPLPVLGPILWDTFGIDQRDLLWQKGKDGVVRFGVYRVTIIYLTERHLAAYACDYNFVREVALNEETYEYHYGDVVGVTTKEEATSYTLPTGRKMTIARMFRVSVTSGESISVTIPIQEIDKITGSDRIPETGAERAIARIRARLRDKKD